MMVLNSGAGADSSLSSRAMIAKGHQMRRRRSSKGTIAGFAFGKTGEQPNSAQSNAESNGDPAVPSEHSGSVGGTAANNQGNKPQHAVDASSNLGKPCHSARLALLCCQNAIKMGARTQLGLCPPGRARRGLKAALRQRTMRSIRPGSAGRGSGQVTPDTGGYFGVDKMIGPEALEEYLVKEEDFVVGSNTFDADSDEEASSGDDDDLVKIDDLLQEDCAALDDEKKYLTLREPLFTPIGAENSLANGGGSSMIAAGGGTGKLPFNRRKLRYFDSVTASDKMASRRYLRTETQRSKQRELMLLSRHLRRMQRQERRRIKQERGETLSDADLSDPDSDDARERALVPAGVSRFEHPMTPSIAAALVIESLSLNKSESIEGMGKCYDGIVAAGVALLESAASDQSSISGESSNASVGNRSKIMAALAPLLITSLEQPSGEVIQSLARLRRMCGTMRYQRRFVQRVAPSLIRPPNGAMWCLKHQNDMEPILAAAELIFDSASEIFSKGWYDRGQLLLADSKRAETLNTAATQLRNLSTGPNDSLTLGGFAGHGNWRSSKFKSAPIKDTSMASNEPLAEWEVIAVDRQIRVSISNIISTDWSRVVVHSRDSEATRSYHRSRTASTKRPTVLPQTSSGDMSPKSIVSSPMSPARPTGAKTPLSPPPPSTSATPPQPEAIENAFPTNFGSEAFSNERTRNPIPSSGTSHPLSPPPPNRSGAEEVESKIQGEPFPPATNLFPPAGFTPPRSPTTPKSPKRELSLEPPQPPASATSTAASPLSPRRPKQTPQVKESISNPPSGVSASSPVNIQFGGDKERAPLSPSSVGTGSSPVEAPYRHMSSASSVASSLTGTGTQPAHYRMLTSTAAERKRTVAACRALRAQITRFEDAFIQLHGRPPKGAAERAPLATTYAQYREWKRAIRADAACRIQALFRGARARWILLRSNDPRISRVILTRAGRRSFTAGSDRIPSSHQENVLNQLSIPAEIGDSDRDTLNTSGTAFASSSGSTGSDGFPTQQNQGGVGQSLPPQWGNQIVRRRSGEGLSGSPVPRPVSSPSGSVSSAGSADNYSRLSLSDLQARKRELKQQLKQYDMNFARRNGRMPVKAEKEPIRHLYERYNALKSHITQMEQEGRHSATNSPVPVPQSQAMLPQRTVSPVSERSDDSGHGSRSTLRLTTSASTATSTSTSNTTPTGTPTDLASLRAEKGRLHQMLRSYERDFFREHQRQVSSFADIRPVASQYRRYKEVKRQINTLQQQAGRSNA